MFARDYSLRSLKNDNAVLLGHHRSNPWIEPLLTNIGIRWNLDYFAGGMRATGARAIAE